MNPIVASLGNVNNRPKWRTGGAPCLQRGTRKRLQMGPTGRRPRAPDGSKIQNGSSRGVSAHAKIALRQQLRAAQMLLELPASHKNSAQTISKIPQLFLVLKECGWLRAAQGLLEPAALRSTSRGGQPRHGASRAEQRRRRARLGWRRRKQGAGLGSPGGVMSQELTHHG